MYQDYYGNLAFTLNNAKTPASAQPFYYLNFFVNTNKKIELKRMIFKYFGIE